MRTARCLRRRSTTNWRLQDETDAAGEKAGEDRVFKSYQDGKVTQSTTDPVTGKNETYNDSLGKTWDDANPGKH